MIAPSLLESYNSANYHVDTSPSFVLKIGMHSNGLENIYRAFHKETAAFITAFNPYSQELSKQENKYRNLKLEELIKPLHFYYI